MDFGQQRLQQQNAAREMMYQNSGYQFERRDRKTLILDVSDVNGTVLACPLGNATEVSVELFEPLIKLVWLEECLESSSQVSASMASFMDA